jgi:hypothetical protein
MSVGQFNAIPSFSSVNIDFVQTCFKIYMNDGPVNRGKPTKKLCTPNKTLQCMKISIAAIKK